jgi:hypothetical protein
VAGDDANDAPQVWATPQVQPGPWRPELHAMHMELGNASLLRLDAHASGQVHAIVTRLSLADAACHVHGNLISCSIPPAGRPRVAWAHRCR